MANAQQLQKDIYQLREELKKKEKQLAEISHPKQPWPLDKLTNEEIGRYSRQIILNEVRVSGQLKLKNSSVLIVGVGGLGCPAALYLVGAGIGHIGLVDYDLVEINNLHRQLLHTETSIGTSKSESAKNSLSKLNSSAHITTYNVQLHSENTLDIIQNYDIILDATDNVATRYLLNDACILMKKPLVSGSALQLEGQLTVYNYMQGPCYRCIFPIPPPPETVTNCGDGGVIGAVPGIIGTLQALETIKIILDIEGVLSSRLLIFDGSCASFRTVKLRGKRLNCDICSEKPIITRLIDYEQFCGMRASDKDYRLSILEDNDRISVYEYSQILEDKKPHILIDVRSANEFEICRIQSSVNIPIKTILENKDGNKMIDDIYTQNIPVYFICRRGNDSQFAVKHLQMTLNKGIPTKDIIGGIHSWARYIDASFPIY